MNTKNIRLLLVISLIALAFGLGTIASQFLPPWISGNLSLSSLFFPTIQKDPLAPNIPSGTLYVFATTGKISPNLLGRSGMNAVCAEHDPATHFCTLSEIENAFHTTGVYFDNSFDQSGPSPAIAWLDNPLVTGSYWFDETTTCTGWTENTTGTGTVIVFHAMGYNLQICSDSLSVACCKWIP